MYPLLLKPIIKNYIWGGERLIDEFGFECDALPAAEAWMLTCRENGVHTVMNGKYRGTPLSEVPGVDAESFPLLVKLIDAADDLSVQVHPGKECAARYPGDSEKTEMWYVIDCAEGSSLILGFNSEFEKADIEEIEKKMKGGNFTELLRRVPVRPGDVFFVEPGTVHAIGRGILLAEVQQNSDTTYRVYDYGRVGADGKPRELHIDKAIDAVRFAERESAVSDTTKVMPCGTVRSLSCDKFSADVVELDGDAGESLSDMMRSLIVLSGSIKVRGGGERIDAGKGDSIFVPAGCGISLSGKGKILVSSPSR